MKTNIIVALITGAAAIAAAVISSVVNYRKLKAEIKLGINKSRLESSYEIKKNAIFESLQLIDSYLSWLDFDSGIRPERNLNLTALKLTKNTRTIYNQLMVTCTNGDLPKVFIEIVCGDTKEKLDLYVKYRNMCRIELGLDEIDMSKKYVFISIVSTSALEKNER